MQSTVTSSAAAEPRWQVQPLLSTPGIRELHADVVHAGPAAWHKARIRRCGDDVPVAAATDTSTRRSSSAASASVRANLAVALRHAVLASIGSMARVAAAMYVLVLFIWAATGRNTGGADVTNASHAAFTTWLSAYGARTSFGGISLDMLPMGLVALGMWSTYRAARKAIRELPSMHPGEILVFFAGVILTQTACTLAAASWAASQIHTVRPVQACIASACAAAAMMWLLAGNLDIADALYVSWRRPAAIAWATVRRFAYAYLAAAAAVYIGLWVANLPHARDVTAPAVSDGMSQFSVALVNIAFAPTVIGWVAIALTGAPIAAGAGHISLLGASHVSWPPLATFAVLPSHMPAYIVSTALIPIAAAAYSAFRSVDDSDDVSIGSMLKCALFAALGAGVGAMALIIATAGSITAGAAQSGWPQLGPTLIGAGYLAAEVFAGVLLALWLAMREPGEPRSSRDAPQSARWMRRRGGNDE